MKKINWREVEGTQAQEPKELEIGVTTVYLRKDIKQTTKNDNGNEIPVWTYKEAQMSHREYEDYLADLEAPSMSLIMQALSDIQADIAMMEV